MRSGHKLVCPLVALEADLSRFIKVVNAPVRRPRLIGRLLRGAVRKSSLAIELQ